MSAGRQSKVRVTISDTTFSLGWWMVMSEDEQGYAPASYLDPVEENSSDTDIHPEDNTNQGMLAKCSVRKVWLHTHDNRGLHASLCVAT